MSNVSSSEITPELIPDEPPGFLKQLWERRVPHFVGSYLAASFGLIQFLEWCVVKDMFSPDYIILTFRFLALLTPSVILVAWYHGRPGPDQWQKVEKIFIPFNLLAAAALLFFMSFNMSFLRAGQTAVTIEDEEGNTIQRVIPNAESRKSVAIFFFDNLSGNDDYEHFRDGITFGLAYDMLQDIMITQAAAYNMIEYLLRLTTGDMYDLALPIQKKLATDYHADKFVSGDFDLDDDLLRITLRLYETKTGKLLQVREYSGVELPELVDEMSLQLRRDLGVPEYHIAETTDLPFREITTDDPVVFRHYMDGLRFLATDNDYPRTIAEIEQAVELDPGFALGWFQLVELYANGNSPGNVGEAMRNCMDLLYTFPERIQFTVKNVNFLVNQQPEKRMKVLEMYREFYPRDPEAYVGLSYLYEQKEENEKALVIIEDGLQFDDNRGLFYGTAGRLCQKLGRFDDALAYYNEYEKQYPDVVFPLYSKGLLLRTLGRYEESLQALNRVVIMEPDNVNARCYIGSIELRKGQFAESLATFEEALREARSPTDRATACSWLYLWHHNSGQIQAAIEWKNRQVMERTQFDVPINVQFFRIELIPRFFDLDREKEAAELVAEVKQVFSNIFSDAAGFADMVYGIGAGDTALAQAGLESARKFSAAFGSLGSILMAGEAEILEMKGDYDAAIAKLQAMMEARPEAQLSRLEDVARNHRLAGRDTEAIEALDRLRERFPVHPRFMLERARVHHAFGRDQEAAHIATEVLEIWKAADEGYALLKEARQLAGQ